MNPAEMRLVQRLVYGIERHEAEAIVERLMNGGKSVSESENPIGTALEGIEEKRRQVEAELHGMDERKAALKGQLKQLAAAAKSLRRITGKPDLKAVPTGEHTCDVCGKVLSTAQGLSTHKTRTHAA